MASLQSPVRCTTLALISSAITGAGGYAAASLRARTSIASTSARASSLAAPLLAIIRAWEPSAISADSSRRIAGSAGSAGIAARRPLRHTSGDGSMSVLAARASSADGPLPSSVTAAVRSSRSPARHAMRP